MFIDRDYRQTLEARGRRARDKWEPFVQDGLGRHKVLADVVIPAEFGRMQPQKGKPTQIGD